MRTYRDEKGEEWLDDSINGVTWHIPDRSEDIIDKNGNWIDE